MKNYVQDGDVLNLVVPYATVTAGQGMLVGSIFGVANIDGVSGDVVACDVESVFDLTKQPSLAIAAGARVFWDDTNRRVTTVAIGNMPIGACTEASGSSDTTVRTTLEAPPQSSTGTYRALTLTPLAALTTDLTMVVPAGHILSLLQRTTTAYTGNTVTLQVGTTLGGVDLVAATDIKAKGVHALSFVDASADAFTPFAGGTIYVRITQTATVTAIGSGQLIAHILPTA